jgi:hypothetical protein
MRQYSPWKRVAALAAVVLLMTYVGLSTNMSPHLHDIPPSALKNVRNSREVTVVELDPRPQPLRRSLMSLETLFQAADNAITKKLDTTPRIVGGYEVAEYPSYGFTAGTGLCGFTLIHPEYV